MQKYFIGSTRFSVYLPGSNAWRMTSVENNVYLADLYSPERMQPRLDIFIRRTLPILEEMSKGYFFKHLVQYSEVMPEIYIKQLEKARDQFSFLVLQPTNLEGESAFGLNHVLKDCDDGIVAWFRLDDDDILSKDYLDVLQKYTNPAFVGMTVSFSCGYAAKFQNGKFSNFKDVYSRFIAIGQCYITGWQKYSGIVPALKIVQHNEVDKHFPSILDSREPMFVYTRHAGQDTSYALQASAQSTLDTTDAYLLSLPSCANPKQISVKFPTLADDAAQDILAAQPIYELSAPASLQEWDGGVQLEGGHEYSVAYSLTIANKSYSPRAAVFFLGNPSSVDITIDGMNLSQNKSIGYYRYLGAGPPETQKRFSFILPQGLNVRLQIREWDAISGSPTLQSLNVTRRVVDQI